MSRHYDDGSFPPDFFIEGEQPEPPPLPECEHCGETDEVEDRRCADDPSTEPLLLCDSCAQGAWEAWVGA